MPDRRADLAAKIHELVSEYFALGEAPRSSGPRLPLYVPSYGADEVNEALDCLLSTQVTMGDKVRRFEKLWAEYLGVSDAIMVNSGSSANLLGCSVLVNADFRRRLQPGDEVIVPAIAWSTTYFPLVNVGLVPVLVDVDLDTFTLEPAEVERAVGPRTRAIVAVHLLGHAADMRALRRIADRHGLEIFEDACQAHGARFEGTPVGTMGTLGTFSFYFSHHISTIEGGMLVTSDPELAALARVLRAHGWTRDVKRPVEDRGGIDQRFRFVNLGFNLRPTELQGAFGLHQIGKLEEFIRRRLDTVAYWNGALRKYPDWFLTSSGREGRGSRSVWFGYPVMVRPGAPFTRDELASFLNARGVETRPMMSGNFRDQPAIARFAHRIVGELPNADLIARQSFFIGNHQAIGEAERAYFKDCIDEFAARPA